MKLSPLVISALAALCVAQAAASVPFDEEAGFAPVVVGADVKLTPALRRHLQTSGSSATTETPTTTTPTTTAPSPTTTAPSPTTATPSTTSPTPTTATPTTTAPTPTTATPEATTATPSATTATPSATTATPSATTSTPSSTTATPSTTSPATSSSTTTDTTTTSAPSTSSSDTATSTQTPTATESAVSSSSGSTSSAAADTSSGSSMSTGAVIGIVVGIVAAVAIIATIIMCVIRKRRDGDDDPLSPFELSMDKGYNPTPGNFTAQNSYNPRAIGASASGSNTRTPPADAVAAGVAYSQFYDNAATSPGSMNRLESNVDSVQTDPGNNPAGAANGTNLWLSAMEPKDNDSYLSAQESPRSSLNSYEMSSNQNVDVDQSSQLSGHSNKESDDFPDHHEDNDSARGSYEL